MASPAENAAAVRRIHRESSPIYGDEGFDAALDALLAKAEAAEQAQEALREMADALPQSWDYYVRIARAALTGEGT